MNIEDERQAFEADQLKRHPGVCLVRWPDTYRNRYVESAFQGWLAAKEHSRLPPTTAKGQNDPTTLKQYRVTYLDHVGETAFRRLWAKTPKLAMAAVEGLNPLFHALSAKRPTVYVPVHLRDK